MVKTAYTRRYLTAIKSRRCGEQGLGIASGPYCLCFSPCLHFANDGPRNNETKTRGDNRAARINDCKGLDATWLIQLWKNSKPS
ncbi:hypothetical protein C8N36_102226 [Pelagimonas varians]|uniref:Uncharacterized protein n=1 Tax=Pelagimonas varians TaxID=696760 RepID=A0A238K299_9RHOB|nr:hypothetical protein C8N36_102226 [Pelagimonas varians]SMX36066.1 hypothetical protein PEV8663_00687 [Pelagimonas varians]